jgi:hypothetical protein
MFTLRVSFVLSPVLTLLVVGASLLRHPFTWSFEGYEDIKQTLGATFIFSMFSLAIEVQLVFRWAFRHLHNDAMDSCS